MLEVVRGAAYRVTDSQTKYIGPRIEQIAQPLPGLGVCVAFLAAIFVVLAGQVLLTRTVWGRYVVAVGTNEQAARFSGIGTRRIRLATFVLCGFLAAAGAVFQVSRLSSADPNGGVGMELAAIAAVVIGGTSLIGGQGSVLRSFLGVLVIATLQTGLAQVGTTEPTKRIVTGAIIVLAVIADVHRRSWSRTVIAALSQILRHAQSPWTLGRALPRIEHQSPARLKVPGIAGHDVKTVTKSSCRQQAIDRRDRLTSFLGSCRELAPESGRFRINPKHSISEIRLQTDKPCADGLLLPPRRKQGDPFGDLAHGEDAQKEVSIGKLGYRRLYTCVTVGLAQLCQDTCVQQNPHSDTPLPGLGSRLRFRPSNDSP